MVERWGVEGRDSWSGPRGEEKEGEHRLREAVIKFTLIPRDLRTLSLTVTWVLLFLLQLQQIYEQLSNSKDLKFCMPLAYG